MTLDEIKEQCARLSMWAHIATVGSDNQPDVVPVHPCWEASTLWIMCGESSVKVRNIAANDAVALHWQVSEKGDGVEIWGTAQVFDDVATKVRLWTAVFDYDLNLFAPGGPENSPGTVFIAVTPQRAVYLETYGMTGTHRWRA